jgi:hypothetical protein
MDEARSARRVPWVVFAIAALALVVTTDERFYGGVRDGQEMLSAAFALSHYGEIGISRELANAAPGAGGEAYSRYGMGTSIAEVLPMLAARGLQATWPGLPTGPLFVLLPVGCLAAAAAFTAASAALLGAGPLLAAAAGLALVFATPAWGYAGSDYSEPLQLAALSLTALAVLKLRKGASSRGWEMAAGASASFAVLVKSLNILPASLLLLPVLFQVIQTGDGGAGRKKKREAPRRMRLRWTLAGAWAAGLALWAAFEIVRFGKLLGGYPGESFDYPFLSGLLRLTLLPNKGLLVYAPFLLFVPLGAAALWRTDRLLASSLSLAGAAYFATAAGWWAWDGQSGWGPRLVVPALPMLVLLSVPALAGSRRTALAAAGLLAAAGIAVNLPGALYPFGPAYLIAEVSEPRPISEARAEGTPYEIQRQPDGTLTATGPHHLSLTPGWWPPYFHWRLLLECAKGGDVAARLAGGALSGLDPPLILRPPARPSASFDLAVAPFRWPFVGRSWLQLPARRVDPYRGAMRDQFVRAVWRRDERRAEALRLALGSDAPAVERAFPAFPLRPTSVR